MTTYSLYGPNYPEVTVESTRALLEALNDIDTTRGDIDIPQLVTVHCKKAVAEELLESHDGSQEDFMKSARGTLLYEMVHHRFDPFSRTTSTISNLYSDTRLAVLKETLRDVLNTISFKERRSTREAEETLRS